MQKRLTAFLFLLLLVATVHPQASSPYQNIGTGNGMPSNYVLAVTEDENGFLWAGTDKGLCRYDGFRWQVWDKDKGLPGNYVTGVFADKRGGLWLLISGKGCFHFTVKTGRLQPVDTEGINPLSIQSDADGNLYMEGKREGQWGGFLLRPGALQTPVRLFELTGNEPLRLFVRPDQKKVLCLWQNEAEWQRAKHSYRGTWPLHPVKFPAGIKPDIRYASDSVIVTGSHYYHFDANGVLKKRLALFPLPNSYAFTCDAAEGLYVYNVKSGYYFINNKHESSFFNSATGLGSDYVNKIYQTRDGTVLIATLGSGLQLIKHNYRKTFLVADGAVRSIIPSSGGWCVQAGNQFYQTDALQAKLKLLGHGNNTVFTLFKSGDTLVAGSLDGLHFFRQRGAALQETSFVEFHSGISSIIRTANGFAAGSYGNGTVFFNEKKVLVDKSDLHLRIVEKLCPIIKGYAALSYEDGLTLVDTVANFRRQFTQADGLLSNSVYSLRQTDDTLWVGTKGGIAILVQNKVIAALRLVQDHENERVQTCFYDRNRLLWAVTNAGLYCLRDGWLKPVGSHPLITSDDLITAAAYDADRNELAIGSNKAFSIVSMNAIVLSTTVAPPQLVQQSVDGNNNVSPTLPYNFSSVQFTLGLGVVSPFVRNRFYYRLQGLNDGWQEMKDSVTLSFSALRPGEYKLLAKAVNADGYESKEEVLSSFTVQKPFWLRLPFLVFCGLAVVVLTAVVVRAIEKEKARRREAKQLLQRTLQAERERIAKDLHDHLGTNLTTIIAQTDNIESRLHRGEMQQATNTVQRLSAHTRETMNVLRETIWAVQETEHSLQEFLLRVRSFLQRFFDGTGVAWEVTNEAVETVILSPAQTLHLFRIVQEASQNILKHAGATEAHFYFSVDNEQLSARIADNGSGATSAAGNGNGLVNIEQRILQLKGHVQIRKKPFTVSVSFPL